MRTPKDFVKYLTEIFDIKQDSFYDGVSFIEFFEGREIDFSIHVGCTKGVLIPEREDFVIKTPLSITEEGLELSNFIDREKQIYNKAKEFKLNQIFVPNIKILEICGHPFYSQERVNIKDIDEKRLTDEMLSFVTALDEIQIQYCPDTFRDTALFWVDDFIKYYSLEVFIRLCKFCGANDVIDIHQNNVGYNKRGAPVIFDYGGIENSF